MSDKTEIQHQLAARYVIGSMRGGARKRFMRLLMTTPCATRTCDFLGAAPLCANGYSA